MSVWTTKCPECEGSGKIREHPNFITGSIKPPWERCPACHDGNVAIGVEVRCDCRCFPSHNRRCKNKQCTGIVCLSPELYDYNPDCHACHKGVITRPLTTLEVEEMVQFLLYEAMLTDAPLTRNDALTIIEKGFATYKGQPCKLIPA